MFDEEYPDSENDKTKDDEDMSIVDELSDDELKNIEIEDQAAATIDDEETVEKVLRESAGTFSSDVADIQEASRENYRILGTIKEYNIEFLVISHTDKLIILIWILKIIHNTSGIFSKLILT